MGCSWSQLKNEKQTKISPRKQIKPNKTDNSSSTFQTQKPLDQSPLQNDPQNHHPIPQQIISQKNDENKNDEDIELFQQKHKGTTNGNTFILQNQLKLSVVPEVNESLMKTTGRYQHRVPQLENNKNKEKILSELSAQVLQDETSLKNSGELSLKNSGELSLNKNQQNKIKDQNAQNYINISKDSLDENGQYYSNSEISIKESVLVINDQKNLQKQQISKNSQNKKRSHLPRNPLQESVYFQKFSDSQASSARQVKNKLKISIFASQRQVNKSQLKQQLQTSQINNWLKSRNCLPFLDNNDQDPQPSHLRQLSQRSNKNNPSVLKKSAALDQKPQNQQNTNQQQTVKCSHQSSQQSRISLRTQQSKQSCFQSYKLTINDSEMWSPVNKQRMQNTLALGQAQNKLDKDSQVSIVFKKENIMGQLSPTVSLDQRQILKLQQYQANKGQSQQQSFESMQKLANQSLQAFSPTKRNRDRDHANNKKSHFLGIPSQKKSLYSNQVSARNISERSQNSLQVEDPSPLQAIVRTHSSRNYQPQQISNFQAYLDIRQKNNLQENSQAKRKYPMRAMSLISNQQPVALSPMIRNQNTNAVNQLKMELSQKKESMQSINSVKAQNLKKKIDQLNYNQQVFLDQYTIQQKQIMEASQLSFKDQLKSKKMSKSSIPKINSNTNQNHVNKVQSSVSNQESIVRMSSNLDQQILKQYQEYNLLKKHGKESVNRKLQKEQNQKMEKKDELQYSQVISREITPETKKSQKSIIAVKKYHEKSQANSQQNQLQSLASSSQNQLKSPVQREFSLGQSNLSIKKGKLQHQINKTNPNPLSSQQKGSMSAQQAKVFKNENNKNSGMQQTKLAKRSIPVAYQENNMAQVQKNRNNQNYQEQSDSVNYHQNKSVLFQQSDLKNEQNYAFPKNIKTKNYENSYKQKNLQNNQKIEQQKPINQQQARPIFIRKNTTQKRNTVEFNGNKIKNNLADRAPTRKVTYSGQFENNLIVGKLVKSKNKDQQLEKLNEILQIELNEKKLLQIQKNKIMKQSKFDAQMVKQYEELGISLPSSDASSNQSQHGSNSSEEDSVIISQAPSKMRRYQHQMSVRLNKVQSQVKPSNYGKTNTLIRPQMMNQTKFIGDFDKDWSDDKSHLIDTPKHQVQNDVQEDIMDEFSDSDDQQLATLRSFLVQTPSMRQNQE